MKERSRMQKVAEKIFEGNNEKLNPIGFGLPSYDIEEARILGEINDINKQLKSEYVYSKSYILHLINSLKVKKIELRSVRRRKRIYLSVFNSMLLASQEWEGDTLNEISINDHPTSKLDEITTKIIDLQFLEIDLEDKLNYLNKHMTDFDAAIETTGTYNDLFKRKKEVLKQLKYVQKQKRKFFGLSILIRRIMDGDV
jgi:hypothetical protein